MSDHKALVPIERIERLIYLIRGQKVMFDSDLAEIYGVTTKRLNEQVGRNVGRFPSDFAFQLTRQEVANLKSQIATSSLGTRTKSGGIFHSVSKQHLPLYLAEFDHRWNHRKSTDGERTLAGLKKVEGKRLTYKSVN